MLAQLRFIANPSDIVQQLMGAKRRQPVIVANH